MPIFCEPCPGNRKTHAINQVPPSEETFKRILLRLKNQGNRALARKITVRT
jgi:hypothetical protein